MALQESYLPELSRTDRFECLSLIQVPPLAGQRGGRARDLRADDILAVLELALLSIPHSATPQSVDRAVPPHVVPLRVVGSGTRIRALCTECRDDHPAIRQADAMFSRDALDPHIRDSDSDRLVPLRLPTSPSHARPRSTVIAAMDPRTVDACVKKKN